MPNFMHLQTLIFALIWTFAAADDAFVSCHPGRYVAYAPAMQGSVNQMGSEAGMHSMGQRKFCNACPPGRYTGAWGSYECSPCDLNTYTPTSNSSRCINCPRGKYTVKPASTHCKQRSGS